MKSLQNTAEYPPQLIGIILRKNNRIEQQVRTYFLEKCP
jgi:hypothetical protein